MILLSASSIKDFIACERKYWYRRFASDLAEPSEALIRGKIVHEIIEKYWDDEEAGFLYLSSLVDNTFDSVKAHRHLDSFYNNFRNLCGKDDSIEERFKINYINETNEKVNDVKIIGMFDRVLPTGVIFDWKTNRSTPKSLDNDPQFLLYYHAYHTLHNKPPASLYFASLTSSRLVRFNFDPYKLDLLLYEIIPNMLRNIREKIFPPSGIFKYNTCSFCPFKEHCHKYLKLEKPNELDSTEFNFR